MVEVEKRGIIFFREIRRVMAGRLLTFLTSGASLLAVDP